MGAIAEIDIQQFGEIIEWTITHGLKTAILGLGAPGIGKSESIQQIAAKYGYHLEDKRLAQMSEVEIGGLMYPSADKTETNWLCPDWFPKENGPKTILLLDEITSAPKRVQVAAYQLVLDRRIGRFKLPESTVVIALGNRAEDNGVYVEMAAPLANRFEIYNINLKPDKWLAWARKANVHPAVTAYIESNPKDLHDRVEDSEDIVFTSPRSWKRVSDILWADNNDENTTRDNSQSDVGQIALRKIQATLGSEVYSKFLQFTKMSQYANLVNAIMSGDKSALTSEERSCRISDGVSVSARCLILNVGENYLRNFGEQTNELYKAGDPSAEQFKKGYANAFGRWKGWVANNLGDESAARTATALKEYSPFLSSDQAKDNVINAASGLTGLAAELDVI